MQAGAPHHDDGQGQLDDPGRTAAGLSSCAAGLARANVFD
jgi:hypothetical protein